MYARLAVNLSSISGLFDYSLPENLEEEIQLGCLVTVPFGKQLVQGVVLELVSQPAVAETKPVFELLDSVPVLTSHQISLAKWLAWETLSPMAACIGLMLPAGLSKQADSIFAIRDPGFSEPDSRVNSWSKISGTELRLVKLLTQRGPLRGRQIDRHFKNVDWRRTAQVLIKNGLLTRHSFLPPPSVRPKFVRTAQLSVPPEAAEAVMPELGKTPGTLLRRQAALR
jgi:primosomal protein N' (replication factor Y)